MEFRYEEALFTSTQGHLFEGYEIYANDTLVGYCWHGRIAGWTVEEALSGQRFTALTRQRAAEALVLRRVEASEFLTKHHEVQTALDAGKDVRAEVLKEEPAHGKKIMRRISVTDSTIGEHGELLVFGSMGRAYSPLSVYVMPEEEA